MPASVRCEIFPADLDATVSFYVNVLGFCVVRDDRGAQIPYLALQRDEVRLGAAQGARPSQREPRRPPTGVELVLEVDDLVFERQRVATAGWPVAEEIADQSWGLRDFRLVDPDGYYWRITTRN